MGGSIYNLQHHLLLLAEVIMIKTFLITLLLAVSFGANAELAKEEFEVVTLQDAAMIHKHCFANAYKKEIVEEIQDLILKEGGIYINYDVAQLVTYYGCAKGSYDNLYLELQYMIEGEANKI